MFGTHSWVLVFLITVMASQPTAATIFMSPEIAVQPGMDQAIQARLMLIPDTVI